MDEQAMDAAFKLAYDELLLAARAYYQAVIKYAEFQVAHSPSPDGWRDKMGMARDELQKIEQVIEARAATSVTPSVTSGNTSEGEVQ